MAEGDGDEDSDEDVIGGSGGDSEREKLSRFFLVKWQISQCRCHYRQVDLIMGTPIVYSKTVILAETSSTPCSLW